MDDERYYTNPIVTQSWVRSSLDNESEPPYSDVLWLRVGRRAIEDKELWSFDAGAGREAIFADVDRQTLEAFRDFLTAVLDKKPDDLVE